MMARDSAFIVPVSLDASPSARTDVPESFHRVQWTRLPAGETPSAFVERVRRLLSSEPSTGNRRSASQLSGAAPAISPPPRVPSRLKTALLAAAVAVVAVASGYLALDRLVLSKRPGEVSRAPTSVAQTAAPSTAVFNPPAHSIAVLPFVNLSGDKEQEYFSDGLTEELLNALAAIDGLQVAARTSSFSFREHPDIVTVAHKLNVGAVLEGSVRRSARTVRVTAQLINAVTGFHLWSKTYDRDLGDVLKLQTDIANAVASALKVTLLGDVAAKIEVGGTHNPAAFDAYLRAAKALDAPTGQDLQNAIAAFGEAIRLDPNYALAIAGRSVALEYYAREFATAAALRETFEKVRVDAQQAITLAPDLAEGHLALADYFRDGALDFARANEEYERALALAPGNARVQREYSRLAVDIGQAQAALTAARRAVVLDPLNGRVHRTLGLVLFYARRYEEAIAAFQDVLALNPDDTGSYGYRGIAYYVLGDLQTARAACESKSNYWGQLCLAIVYDKLARHPEAEAQLAKARASLGDAAAYQYAWIYAQWGNKPRAIEWLETALRLRDPGLQDLRVDLLLDPLRKEPRFQAIERTLKFP